MGKRVFLIVAIILIIVALISYKILILDKKKLARLRVDSSPNSSVYLDDKVMGKTPFDQKIPPKDYAIKLIPDVPESNASSWQSQIFLKPNIETYIRRDLGSSELASSGELLYLEKISGNSAQIEINASPEAAKIVLDGQEIGSAPFTVRDISAGEHEVGLNAPGFISRSVKVKTIIGYKLYVNIQLALSSLDQNPIATPGANITPSAMAEKKDATQSASKNSVQIKDTPTGFLRVRNSPSTGGDELTQIKPGSKYRLLDEKDGWYKIALPDNQEGWISARYADKVSD